MIKRRASQSQRGFTIVELLIVIVVIGILAAIVIVAYNGIQKMAATASVKSDLSNVSKKLKVTYALAGAYPDVLPGDAKVSSDTIVEYVRNVTGGYNNLNTVLTGVLFHSICQQLVSEGYGRANNNSNVSEQYITGCHVYNNNAMQINGWDSHNFTIPISNTAVSSWYNANITSDPFRPNKKTAYMDFANELQNRFTSLGGTFPVTSFWDPWANSSNGGVPIQTLPPPNAPSDPNTFCVQASHAKYSDLHFYANQDSNVVAGTCP